MTDTLKRALFHICCGLSIPVASLFLPEIILLVALGVITSIFIAFDLTRLRVPAINRWFLWFFKPLTREKEVAHPTGSSYMLLAALIAFLSFPGDIAALALSFLAVGDPAATIVGKRIGRRKLWGKSLEGSAACLISCVAIGFVFRHFGLNITPLAILVGSVCATIMEAIPLPINDNLTMPLFAGAVMTIISI